MRRESLSTAHVKVDFKIAPKFIHSENIKKFPQSGGLGDVWKSSLSTPSETLLVALKSIRVRNLNDSELRQAGWRIRREAYVWLQLSHDHIVPFEGIIMEHDFGPLPALVSLWMQNGTLNEYLKREFPQLSDRRKLELIQQVAAGLSYLHGKYIAHGDLTPNNILLDGSRNLRLTDFGLSMVVPESGNVTFGSVQAGHTRWMAPEFIAYANDSEEPQSPPKPTKAGDIYSFGCIMLQIFSGKEPYSWIQCMTRVNNAIWSGQEPFRGVEINTDEAYRLLSSRCLSREPEERPSILGVTTIVDPVKVLAVASRPLPAQIFEIHPLLAYHHYIFPINYDVSHMPETASSNVQASPISLDSHRHTAATNPPASVLFLKNDLLPCRCEIRASTYRYITVEDVLYQLSRFLRTPGTREDYEAIPSQRMRDQIVEGYKRRCLRAEEQNQGLERVDFLIGHTTFMGLSRTELGPDVLVLNLQ